MQNTSIDRPWAFQRTKVLDFGEVLVLRDMFHVLLQRKAFAYLDEHCVHKDQNTAI